ncbi:MAG TPA: Sec-independent protein translocase protein TatB [Caulobacteraceae bacterium]|nr:Sec-independent protein translocase protein TatB [Caulobacteraceae bacterium]
MLPDLSAAHIFLLVVVALVVVGPKDLPGLLRKIGQFMARLRGMANEFRASFDEMARQSELDELRREVAAMRAAATKPMEEFRSAADAFHSDLSHGLSEGSAPPSTPAFSAEPSAAPPSPVEAAPAPATAKARKAKATPSARAKAPAAKTAAASSPAKSKAPAKKPKPKTAPRGETGE